MVLHLFFDGVTVKTGIDLLLHLNYHSILHQRACTAFFSQSELRIFLVGILLYLYI